MDPSPYIDAALVSPGVFRVVDPQRGVARALRRIHADPEDRSAIRHRIRILARITHPALPPWVAQRDRGDALELVEGWIEGLSLTQLVERDGRLGGRHAQAALEPVVEALVAIHGCGLAHGHVGSNSILVDDEGRGHLVGRGVRAGRPIDDLRALAEVIPPLTRPSASLRALVTDVRVGDVATAVAFLDRLKGVGGTPTHRFAVVGFDEPLMVRRRPLPWVLGLAGIGAAGLAWAGSVGALAGPVAWITRQLAALPVW